MPQVPVTIVGNLAADPDLRITAQGKPVASLRVGVTDRVKTDDGWRDRATSWYSVTCWKALAENVVESLSKGMRVVVVGRLEIETYETKDGEKRSAVKITANSVGPALDYATAKVTKNTKADAKDGEE